MVVDLRPEQRPYRPWGTCEDIFYSRDRILIASGPAGTGKSRGILEKLHYLCLKYRKLRVLIVRKTRRSLTEAALYTYEELVLPENSPIKHGAQRANRSSYQYPNGSMIAIAGFDDNSADRIMSTEWDFIFIQEGIEVDEETTEKLEMRLRNYAGPYRQLIIDTNPGPPTHWLLKWVKEGRARIIHTKHEDNPRFFDHATQTETTEGKEYFDSLRAKRGHLLDRYYYGKWVQPEGARWSHLDDRIHGFKYKERFPQGLPQSWPLLIGGDYGTRAPYAAIWFAIDFDGDAWAFRERYETGMLSHQQAEDIRSATGPGEYISRVRLDPQYWQTMPVHQEGQKAERYIDRFIQIIEADDRFGPVEKGFNKSRLLALNTLDSLLDYDNGFPNLHIDTELCPNLWAELTGAVWSDKDKEEDISDKSPDHAITATYYALHGDLPVADLAPPPIPPADVIRAERLKEIEELDARDASLLARQVSRF